MSRRWSVNEPWVGDGRAMGERPLVKNSKLCPESVRVQGLSRGCPSLSHHLSAKQTILSPSKDCPSPIFVQNLSNAEKCGFGILLLDTVLTNTGFSRPISVHEYLLGQGLDRPQTAIGQNLNLAALLTDLGQGLDNLWTEVGFYVQSLSNQPMGTSTQLFVSNRVWT